MERAKHKTRFAILEICSLLFSFWRRSRRITTRIHVTLVVLNFVTPPLVIAKGNPDESGQALQRYEGC
jgi:hypothetical protein